MAQLDHVDQFLSHVDGKGTILKIGELMVEAARQDAGISESLSAIEAWAQKQNDRLPEQVAGPRISGVIQQGPVETTLMAVCYMRAEAGLQTDPAKVPSDLPEMKKALANATKQVETLEPDFFNRLLIETEGRAGRDPIFAHKLASAKEDLVWVGRQLPSLPESNTTQTPQATSASSSQSKLTPNGWRLLCAVVIVICICVSGPASKHN